MTSLLVWIIIFMQYLKAGKTQECQHQSVKNASFVCTISILDTKENLQCKSNTFTETNSYFMFHLPLRELKLTTITPEDILTSFLNFEIDSNSSFSICKDVPAFWDVCSRDDGCLTHVVRLIKESNVQHLNISNSEVSLATFNVFSHLTSITVVDAIIKNFTSLYFHHSLTLQDLILRNDSLKHLSEGMLKNNDHLKTIDLSINHLEAFPQNAFGIQKIVKYLNISHNLLQFVSNDTFHGFPNLEELYLSNNNLTTIDENTFNFNLILNTLDLSHNAIKFLPQKLFSKLHSLKRISCVQCQLYELGDELLINSPNVVYVDFRENYLSDLPNNFFANQSYIESIYLSQNRISTISPFKNKKHLKVLLLDQNRIASLNEHLFLEAPHLFFINISYNHLNILTDDHIRPLRDVGLLDLSNNNITSVTLGKNNIIKIRTLKISNNAIKSFDVEWKNFVYLEKLHMDNNEVSHLKLPPCIPNVKQTITFFFQNNKITKVGLQELLKDEDLAQTSRRMMGCLFNGMAKNFVDLTNNPLICDCDLYHLHNYIIRKQKIKLNSFLNVQDLKCDTPTSLKNELISVLPDDVFSCKITKDCPSLCFCGIRGKDNRTFVNCTNAGFREVPRNAPPGTTVLYFNNNYLSNIVSLNTETWENLTELYADNNDISDLSGWGIPKSLNYLSLKGNKIFNIPDSFTKSIVNSSTFHLYISNNDTNCNCDKKSLQNFLLKNIILVKDIGNITCEVDNNGTKSLLPLYKIPSSILCPDEFVQHFSKSLIIWLCLLFILLISTVLIYYKQRQLILSYLFIHCEELFRIFCEESDYDEEKVFDGFIAYSSSDRDIMMELLKELEEKEPYFQLCIHERDWLPGRYISDNIIHSVQSSKRTIIILSDSFIASPWFRLELRAAVFKVSKDKMNKIIVILANSSTSLDGIDTELRHVITKRTYLVWGERWFWEKLRYAMPHKTCDQKPEQRATMNDDRSSEIVLIGKDSISTNSFEV